ncbi:MAG: 4-hydroxythreonine-4-phosphate dehydrogenase PdxA [Candidatus Saganbacteria bacterium]|nr:4-hydroxythreonine-4-phosphate dehydrogenase PdxA [Candidatus Saganbacteria bacterium]
MPKNPDSARTKPIIGVTMGDPAGIGPEICAKALLSPEVTAVADCLVIGDRRWLPPKLKVLDLHNADPGRIKPGQVSKAAGQAAFEYIVKAIRLAQKGEIDGIATGPINKEALRKAGHKFAGHTEILAAYTRAKEYGMMFVSDKLWVILVTTHLPLRGVSKKITKKSVLRTIRLAHETLLKVRGRKPKIGVAGLNPHAGENGLFGDEERKAIRPAVEEAKKRGINVEGPVSPDAIFYLANAGMYDIIVAMYHDQGLIPLKLLSFNRSVNVTVGLPIIRTSVDHGTGFDIAGKGWANPQSLIEAIQVAAHFSRTR